MISEGSCDTEDWSNDASHHRNKLYFKIYSERTVILNCNHFTLYYCKTLPTPNFVYIELQIYFKLKINKYIYDIIQIK